MYTTRGHKQECGHKQEIFRNGTSREATLTTSIPIDAEWSYLYYEVVLKSLSDANSRSCIHSKYEKRTGKKFLLATKRSLLHFPT